MAIAARPLASVMVISPMRGETRSCGMLCQRYNALTLSRTKREPNPKRDGGVWERRRLSFCFYVCSVRGEGRGIGFDRRLGAHRGFGRFGLLLIPFDRLGLAHQCARQNLVHARNRHDVETLLDAVAD